MAASVPIPIGRVPPRMAPAKWQRRPRRHPFPKSATGVITSFFPNCSVGRFNSIPEQWSSITTVVDRVQAVSAEALSAMPNHLTVRKAATLPCVAVTMSCGIGREGGRISPHTRRRGLAVAIQLAKALGAR